jgi:DNA-binding beta-propeller fold protein YncE
MPGTGKGQFGGSARGVACDSTRKVYVVESSNHCIQVFTTNGEFVRMFGKHGQGHGELDWPNGIAIDASGMVYVSEGRNNAFPFSPLKVVL